jgi:hypothetical protein
MIFKRLSILSLLSIVTFSTYAQQASTAVTQNPTAVSLARNSAAVLSGSVQISDITLTGSATRTAGSDSETGSITLKALGNPNSRFDLVLTSGTSSEIRNASGGATQGSWITPDGVSHAMAGHNTFTDAAWFVPELTVLSQLSNPNLIVSYVGQETRAGAAVQHLHFAIQSASTDPTGFFIGLSAEDVYLDSSTFLLVALIFNTHPDNDASTNISVEIDFSSYQPVKGVQVPFHIQKLLNGTLFLDVTVQAANINSGLSETSFLAQ